MVQFCHSTTSEGVVRKRVEDKHNSSDQFNRMLKKNRIALDKSLVKGGIKI
jgi:hypothetical protein